LTLPSNTHERIFLDSYADLLRATRILKTTLDRAQQLPPPVGDGWCSNLSDDDLLLLDALCVRFSRCQDLIGPCLRSLAYLENPAPKNYDTILAVMHERGVINLLINWKLQRALRNEGVHIYLSNDESLIEFYAAILHHAVEVARYAEIIRDYAHKSHGFFNDLQP